jgi:hypothetical protein
MILLTTILAIEPRDIPASFTLFSYTKGIFTNNQHHYTSRAIQEVVILSSTINQGITLASTLHQHY